MKIWVDDIRIPPADPYWAWAKSSHQAIVMLENSKYLCETQNESYRPEIMSLDHDLGGDDTTRPVVLWMCENGFWPDEVKVHSANPVGIEWLVGMIERYKQ